MTDQRAELRSLIIQLLDKIDDERLLGFIYGCVNRSFVNGHYTG